MTDKIGSLTISTSAADQSYAVDPAVALIEIPNVVPKEKRRYIPNPAGKRSKQRKLHRDFEKRHHAWSNTKERWTMIAESLFPLLSSGQSVFDAVKIRATRTSHELMSLSRTAVEANVAVFSIGLESVDSIARHID